jgi:ABC-type glycerol-3-phosphate transport system substrate-binding protein
MTSSRRKIHRTAAAASLLVGLAGCASIPPPTSQLSAADAAITVAATPDGQRYAAEELAAAHNELTAAQAAMAKQDYDRAEQLAAASMADADLAHAKGRALAAQSAAAAKTEDNATLRRRLLDQEPLK